MNIIRKIPGSTTTALRRVKWCHTTSRVAKYSFLDDMDKLRNPFDELSYARVMKWFTHPPNIKVPPVDDTEIWRSLGGSCPREPENVSRKHKNE